MRIDYGFFALGLRFGFAFAFALLFGFAFTLLFGFAFTWLDTAAALFFATFLSVFARLRMTFPVALAVFFPSFRPRGSGGRGDDFDHRRRHAVDELLLAVLRHRLPMPDQRLDRAGRRLIEGCDVASVPRHKRRESR